MLATAAPACGLCALLRRNGSAGPRRTASSAAHGLRIALVADDGETCLAARRMIEAQRDGWIAGGLYPPSSIGYLRSAMPKGRPNCHTGASAPRRPDRPRGTATCAELDCVRKLKALAPDLRMLVIGSSGDEAAVVQPLHGRRRWLFARTRGCRRTLRHAVGAVAQGGAALCPEAQRALLNVLHRATAATTTWAPGLTHREQEIAGCLVAHLSNKEISSRLGMDEETVHVHLVRLYAKLHVHNRQEAAAKLLGGGTNS